MYFFWSFDLLFQLGHFFLSGHVSYIKGRSLRCSPGRGNPHHCIVVLSVVDGSNAVCSALCWLSVTSPTTHKQIGPFWYCFRGGWVCVLSRTLWVSPRNSPVRLGVCLTATSNPTGVFNQWFEALFPQAGALGFSVCLIPQLFFLAYLHTSMGPPCPQAPALPALVLQPPPC